jgi:hypothetical protein
MLVWFASLHSSLHMRTAKARLRAASFRRNELERDILKLLNLEDTPEHTAPSRLRDRARRDLCSSRFPKTIPGADRRDFPLTAASALKGLAKPWP